MTDAVHKDALDRFKESQEVSDENRNNAIEDIEFSRLAEQWPEEVRKLRQLEGRPCLTINRMPAFIRQVVNESRQNKPAIKVSPVDNFADEDTANVIAGLVRSIERSSQAAIAYDTAIDHAVSGGFGFFRITTDYASPESFEMEARIERIHNPLMVHWDISSTQFDASDWEYAFVSDIIDKEIFKKRYPKAEPVDFRSDSGRGDIAEHWLDGDKVRVAEYWLREEKEREIVLIRSPRGESVVRAEDMPDMARRVLALGDITLDGMSDKELIQAAMFLESAEEVRRRKAKYYTVKRRIMSGAEVLEEEDWPGSMIPICPVWGEEVICDGKRLFRSMIRDARDPQQMFNFWRSASTELVALAPRAPWVGPKGFIPKGHEKKWETANTRSHAYLEYDSSQAPQRQPFAGVPAGALQEALNAADDMKAITGIYDPSLGARSNETSGRAILARQRESDVSNFHFIDNLSRAIAYAGRVLVEIIPHIYSQREAVRILGEDSREKVARLMRPDGPDVTEDGERLYDLSVGRYDVTVSTGPSYATHREETRETLIEIMRSVPGAAPLIGDILMNHMDFEGAEEVAERLRALLPPQVQGGQSPQAAALAQSLGAPQAQPGAQPAQPPVQGGVPGLVPRREAS